MGTGHYINRTAYCHLPAAYRPKLVYNPAEANLPLKASNEE